MAGAGGPSTSGGRQGVLPRGERMRSFIWQGGHVARPSIVPIALTLDDRTGYTLWAPPWEEDGEEWQAFLGTSEDDGEGGRAVVHLFPSPAALAAYCRTSTDHDLADHPVWPVVTQLGAADLTPDDDHRYDLDGVYDIAAENPDRWAVEELAATIDIVSRLAECLDTSATDEDEDDDEGDDETQFEAVAELAAKPEIGSLGLGVDAFAGRSGEDAWGRVGRALDEMWEDVVEELNEHFDWTGARTSTLEDYPPPGRPPDLRRPRTPRRRPTSRTSTPRPSRTTSFPWATTSRPPPRPHRC